MWSKTDENRSEEVREILGRPPRWIVRRGLSIIFFIILIFLILANQFKYPDFIKAQIVVTTQNPPEKIEARINGKIEDIFVQNQQFVKEGQVLANIESSANIEDLKYLRRIIDTLQVNYSSFEFPIEKISPLSLGELESTYVLFEKAYVNYSLQKDLNPYLPVAAADNQTLSVLDDRIEFFEKQKNIETAKIKLKKNELSRHEDLYNKGIISLQQFEDVKSSYLQSTLNLENLRISISRLNESKIRIRKNLASNQIREQQDNTNFLKSVLQSYDQLKKSLEDWEQTYLLKSSIEGQVSFQQFWGANQYIKPGEVIFTILPLNKDHIVGKLILPARNTGKIKAGQKVLIKLDNYPYQEFGMVEGLVKSVSLTPNNNGFYFVEVTMPDGGLITTYNLSLLFDKEMSGSAEIVTKDLSVMERIFYPIKSLIRSSKRQERYFD